MKSVIVFICVIFLSVGTKAEIESNSLDTNNLKGFFEQCLQRDSISCLQLTVFRRAKSVFDNPNIKLFNGVSLEKNNEGRLGKSMLEDNSLAVEVAPSFEARNYEMKNYFMSSMKNFFEERSLKINFANTAEAIARAIPSDIKTSFSDLVQEARTGKKKKLLKKLLPFLIAIKAKVAVSLIAAAFGIAMLAKKAFKLSVLAFGMAVIANIIQLVSKAKLKGSFLHGLSRIGGFGGNSEGGSAGWHADEFDYNGAYSSPNAHSVAYNGYKETTW